MKFCSECGNEVVDNAVVYVKCGCAVGRNIIQDDNPNVLYTLLGAFQPIIALVLYIIWKDEKLKCAKNCLNGVFIGLALSVAFIILWFVFVFLLATTPFMFM